MKDYINQENIDFMNIKGKEMRTFEEKKYPQEVNEEVFYDLYESEPIQLQTQISTQQVSNEEIVSALEADANMFKLDCGLFLFKVHKKLDLKLALYYHAKHTQNFDEFIESINKFLTGMGMVLTDGDTSRLKSEYNKFRL